MRLFDIKSGTKYLVTRGTYTIEGGGTQTLTIPTYGNAWQFNAGDTLRLEITNVGSPYIAPSKLPSATTIGDVTLAIPVR